MSKILLVDDQKSAREKLKLILYNHKKIKVVGTAASGEIAIKQAEALQPDIILLDIQMPDMNGIETTRIINNRFPKSKIIIFTSFSHLEYFKQIKDVNIAATIPKDSTEEEIIHVIEKVNQTRVKLISDFRILLKYSGFLLLSLPLLIVSILIISSFIQPQKKSTLASKDSEITQKNRVVTLGKIVPKGEIIKLSVANAEDSRVDQLLVQEGDRVKKNQVIAILQGIDRSKRDLEEAQKNVELAQAQLEKTRAGETKQAELAAQRANISRLESQLQNETTERQASISSAIAQLKQANLTYERNKSLQNSGAVSQQDFDRSQESLDIANVSSG